MNKTYTYKTVQEIAEQVPEGKIDEFLADFKTWLLLTKGNYKADKTVEAFTGLVEVLGKLQGLDLKDAFQMDKTKLVWCDDGKRNVSKITVVTKEANHE